MKGKLFQLYDADNMPVSIFYSENESIPNDVIELAWTEYSHEESNWVSDEDEEDEENGIDGFEDYVFEHLGLDIERVFVEDIFIQ